ncbi:ras guanine nucleotide exchange factor domain-containing protein [Obelidium mucronatum]|nr:ras guanine nucleotide exchange factor domain-containing protein [Obelidium mucronatum]
MFSNALLATSAKYTTPSTLLDTLLDLYDEFDTEDSEIAHPMQLRILSFICTWVSTSFERDFDDKMKTTLALLCSVAESVEPLTAFSVHVRPYLISLSDNDHRQSSLQEQKPKLITPSKEEREDTLVERRSHNGSRGSLFLSDLLPKKQKTWCELFLDLDSAAIAKQLTLLDSRILRSIEAQDMLAHVKLTKSESSGDQLVSAVDTNIGHFNFISAWVVTRVLMGKKPKSRAKMIFKFVEVAQELRRLNNFNTLMAVLSGLTSTPIHRLKQTQSVLQLANPLQHQQQQHEKSDAEQQRCIQTLRDLSNLMSPDKSFANYRSALKSVAESGEPCIPYLGVMYRDLIYIEEGNKDFLADGVSVNVAKALMMGDVLLTLQYFQSRLHQIKRDPYILGLILESTALSSEQSYHLSLELEPRQQISQPVI